LARRNSPLRFRGYLFDLDGTIYRGERLLPGAERVVSLIRREGGQVVFLSNKPITSRRTYAEKLTRLGIPTHPEDVINSSYVTARYLQAHARGEQVFVIGEPPLLEEFTQAGIILSDDPSEVRWVVAAFDRTFDYRKLNIAFQAIRRGAHFIATNGDRTCPVEGGEIPDAGAIIGALEGCTGKKVELIVGKPSSLIVEAALDRLGLPASQCLMVGDRLETDILMGKEVGLATALVLTGVTSRGALEISSIQPDYVLDSVEDLLPHLGLYPVPESP